jgi:hypothetical protein
MSQAMMTQKQKTLAEAAHANPYHRFINLYSLMHWDYGIRMAMITSQQKASSWRAGCRKTCMSGSERAATRSLETWCQPRG